MPLTLEQLDKNEMVYEFSVHKQNVEKCFRFAEELYNRRAGSLRDFGTEVSRGEMDFIADQVRGKMAEFAFQSFLIRNLNIVSEVDEKIYDGCTNTDNGHDLRYLYLKGSLNRFNVTTDIKNIGPRSQWLLIEKHKFWADAYIAGRITASAFPGDSLFEQDPYRYKDIDWKIHFQGYALREEIYCEIEQLSWFQFKKGERLFKSSLVKEMKDKAGEMGPSNFNAYLRKYIEKFSMVHEGSVYIGPKLKAELNYGFPITWLRNTPNDWQQFKELIIQNSEIVHTRKAGPYR